MLESKDRSLFALSFGNGLSVFTFALIIFVLGLFLFRFRFVVRFVVLFLFFFVHFCCSCCYITVGLFHFFFRVFWLMMNDPCPAFLTTERT